MFSEKKILSLIEEYSKTIDGKKKISERIKGDFIPTYAPTGKSHTVNSLEEAKRIAENMKAILYSHISKEIHSFELDDIIVEKPIVDDPRGYIINISFDADALQRKSLCPALYPEGVEDIVALFVNGYTAKNRVYGKWDGHTDKRIMSLDHREPSSFIEDAVNEFKTMYGSITKVNIEPKYTTK